MCKKFLFFIIYPVLLAGCAGKQKEAYNNAVAEQAEVKYAKGFIIEKFENYKKITIKNPWIKGAVQQTLYLVENEDIRTPQGGLKIVVPVDNIAVASITYYGHLELLGKINSVKGACWINNIPYNETINRRFESKDIVNLGDAFSPDIEQIMMLQPQIFMLSSYNQQDEAVKRLVNAGVSVVYNNEWTETSLLARAEWLKFIAAFYDKEKEADTIFDRIEKNYLDNIQLVENDGIKPTILAGGNFKGTWYMGGGKSYMGQLFADAGGDYFFKNDTTTTSLALSYEMVLKNFHSCDVWLNAPVNTLEKLFAMDERNKLFKAAQSGNVFAFTARSKENGANDFWESGIANPDIILKDVIWALYPALMAEYKPVYIERVK